MKYDLKYFILRSNTLLIYREAIKFTGKIKDPFTRQETRVFIRNEFEGNRAENNRKRIEYMLGAARKRLNEFKETFSMTN
jgi:hypothetical protein